MDLSYKTIDKHSSDDDRYDDRYDCNYQEVDHTNEADVEDDSPLIEMGADNSNDITIANIVYQGDIDTLTRTLARDALWKRLSSMHDNSLFNKQESKDLLRDLTLALSQIKIPKTHLFCPEIGDPQTIELILLYTSFMQERGMLSMQQPS
ncbi:hypothetical protein DAKH74_034850 [Maudiozyma humilis]|uniref:Uncharacterized protein n=1 Tax=Maudiozyma humilis TaxID=51915 RepID=A0AAV5S2L8_MAUHU|nr:hypothetical protein DAKH74_034850 [Kazachstania humilis]